MKGHPLYSLNSSSILRKVSLALLLVLNVIQYYHGIFLGMVECNLAYQGWYSLENNAPLHFYNSQIFFDVYLLPLSILQ